jgi:putative transposase
MCSQAGVSRAGYYRHWEASEPLELDTALRDRMQQLALSHRHYGYRRIHQCLLREGWVVNHKKVLRLMQQDNLLCLRKKRFVPATTNSRHHHRVWSNLTRGLQTSQLHELWVADITYIRLKEEFVYLAVILDAHSRRVIGWALEPYMTAELAIAALRMALETRQPKPGLIHHSDRGVQYACGDYTEILLNHGIQISMSRPAYPYDNARAESFMKTLKYEQIHGEEFRNLEHLRNSIHQFLEDVYNRQRLHSALSYLTPSEFEEQMQNQEIASNTAMPGKEAGCPLPQTPTPAKTAGVLNNCP